MKSVNLDSRSKKRLRFTSSKERSKKATADVYRSYKDRIAGGVTSASTRERYVHNPQSEQRPKKRQRRQHQQQTRQLDSEVYSKDRSKTAVVTFSAPSDDNKEERGKNDDVTTLELEEIVDVEENEELDSSTFASELDLAMDRNASEIFGKFNRQIWLLVRSLPELLHNLSKVIDILMSFMLSPASLTEQPTPLDDTLDPRRQDDNSRNIRPEFVVNLATTDILHLLAVLARDVRHEIHPYLHTKILPRIINDMLNPPPPPPDSEQQPIPLDVTIVEASFRCMAYIFKYDSNLVVNDMETMRQYYGMTLGNRRELIRRLSAETFAPLIRKMKNQKAKERHVRRVLRALSATSQQPPSRILQRIQTDAVDGLSQLCFQIVRGISGKLHSDGAAMIRFLLEMVETSSNDEANNKSLVEGDSHQDLVFDVVSGMLDKICYLCNGSTFGVVSKEMFSVFRSYVETFCEHSENTQPAFPIMKHLKLIIKAVTWRAGYLIEKHSDKDFGPLCKSVSTLCASACFGVVPPNLFPVLLELLCELWVALQKRGCMKIPDNVQSILQCKNDDQDFQRGASVILANRLLPQLRDEHDSKKLSSLLLSAAAEMPDDLTDAALEILFAVTSSVGVETPDETNESFSLFQVYSGDEDIVSSSQQKSLLNACLSTCSVDLENHARLSLTLRCVPFVVTARRSDLQVNYGRAAKWTFEILNSQNGSLMLKALCLECFAALSTKVLDVDEDNSFVRKMTLCAIPLALDMVMADSQSLWVNRGVASLLPLLQTFSLYLSTDADSIFEVLTPNLCVANHFLRLHTLQILASFPPKSYVVDHADLDLGEDLDEEESFRPAADRKPSGRGPVGPCKLLELLLELEASQVSLAREKELLSLVGKIEVVARSGRIPVLYAEAACNHMLGMFHIKFAPLWTVAQKTITILLDLYEDVVWPPFEAELVAVMKELGIRINLTEPVDLQHGFGVFERHYAMCQSWEKTFGKDVSLFNEAKDLEDGEVPKFLATDPVTVMESIWKTAVMSHRIVVKHSRIVVPLFLGFLRGQLFSNQTSDNIFRELHLEELAGNDNTEIVPGYVVQKRLKAFLSVFAAIDGPQQLVQHKVLENVFRSLLVHQDTQVVELALSSLVKFKIPSLVRYKDMVSTLLQKGKLRNALLDLTEQISSEKMNVEERVQLIPILSRILFGRVTARAGRSTSKDSPGARRTAVLSFLSILCQSDSDLFPFLYLMMRSFVPQNIELATLESITEDNRCLIMDSLLTTRSGDITVPGPVIEGFLHLLESVISQLGFRIVAWIPQLTSITIEICKLAAVNTSTGSNINPEGNNPREHPSSEKEPLRRGAIRSLCFQRLSDLFVKFASGVDFTQFSRRFWEAVDPSLQLLPQMVVRSQDCPALLTLLRTISEHHQLIDLLLVHEVAVGVVVECIAATSMHSVMHSSMAFVENLLSLPDEISQPKGRVLIRKFAPKLVLQFNRRFQGERSEDSPEDLKKGISQKGGSRSPTWRRELQLLCQVSEFVSENVTNEFEDSFAGSLFHLLVPFLGPNQGTTDEDKANVVGILSSISSHLDSSAAYAVYDSLSRALGPNKSKEGISSLPVRQGIANLIDKLSLKVPRLGKISSLVVKISSTDPRRLEELDFELVIPGLNSLAEQGDSHWKHLFDGTDSVPTDLIPLINCCFHYIYNEDGVISRAAFNGLKELVDTAAQLTQAVGEENDGWMKLVESLVIPFSRNGLESRNIQVRRFCILLVREITRRFEASTSVHVCGDLRRFCDDENADLDFFLGITHVQIHRRARAFRRLRKILAEISESPDRQQLSSQSLVNVLIPLTLHPLYESKTTSEEGLALEAIATLGALSRELSWSKYNTILWSLLSQFDRHPSQERYLVGAMCAMIDSFHFDLMVGVESIDSQSPDNKTSVWRSLENRIIPKMESIVTKQSTDKSGNRIKSLRPSIVLALTKLFQKFPQRFFENKLSNILAVVCDVLRSRDSNTRDVARTTLAKIVCSMDLKFFGDVIRELALSLNEGYKLHVRAATLHTILLELSKVYETPTKVLASSSLPFDNCVPALMDLLQEDLFGEANERRESQENNVRFVKEAIGNKSVHSVEMISRMIVFLPSEDRSRSSVHCVVSPFIERLRKPDADARTVRRIKEVLSRIVSGLSNNKSVVGEELLPFVHATLLPFVSEEMIESVKQESDQNDDDDVDGERGEEERKIYISGTRVLGKKDSKASKMMSRNNVAEWRPSTLQSSTSGKTALGMKRTSQRNLRSVQDGLNAPKLTGSSRHGLLQSFDSKAVSEPAAATAVLFGLTLLSASQKKNAIIGPDILHMLDPFVPLLTALVCYCRDTEIALLALKCLQNFLRFDLPSVPSCCKSLGSQTLKLLSSSSSNSNQSDMTQACFKTLTYLIKLDGNSESERSIAEKSGEQVFTDRSTMPLDSEQLKVLCSILQISIAETEQHNPALTLIKAMMSHRYMSPEFYDLMDAILKLVVRSPKPTLRQQGAGLFVQYLLDYPMGEERFDQHLKQIIANISYEYQEGRTSAVAHLTLTIEKLPLELLEKHAQTVFLPLVMQLLNEESKVCRVKVADCIKLLFTRCSSELLHTFQDYCARWSKQNGPLCLASLQVFALMVESRPDFLRSASLTEEWTRILDGNLQHRQDSEWETTYFSLLCVEKLFDGFKAVLCQELELWSKISECLVEDHPWVKLSSSRILKEFFSSDFALSICEKNDGLLFDIVRNLCFQLNAPESDQSEALCDLATKTLSQVLPLMKERPELCYKEDEDEKDPDGEETRDPIFWLMRRLSQIAKNKGRQRRMAVFKCYAAFATSNFSLVAPHLELMLDGLHRSMLEGRNETETQAFSQKKNRKPVTSTPGADGSLAAPLDEHEVAEEVLRLLEESTTSPEEFLTAYAAVKRRAREKKDKRKTEEKAQAVLDPRGFAQRKIQKQVRNGDRRKRRGQEQRRERGGLEKRRRSS